MVIYFKDMLGTFLAVKSKDISAFEADVKDYDYSKTINICMIMASGQKEIVNTFFISDPFGGWCNTRAEASKYIDRISNLLTENAEYAEVYTKGEIILSDGREL